MGNLIKTTLLLTLLTLLLVWMGRLLGGPRGMSAALVLAGIINLGAWWFSDRLVLARYRAEPVSAAEAPELHVLTAGIAEKAGIPTPRICIIPSAAPNAFAAGRNPEHAVIAVTEGILNVLNREELAGVLAHEIGHVLHRDTLISSVAATLAGALSMLAAMFRWSFFLGGGRSGGRRQGKHPFELVIMSLLAPVAAVIIQLAVSRSREFNADRTGARLCGNPLFLAKALRKLEAGSKRMPLRNAEPATAHLFIVSPLQGGGLARLFSTHPPLEERVARLIAMAHSDQI